MIIIELDLLTNFEIDGNQARIVKDGKPGAWHMFDMSEAIELIDVMRSDPKKVIFTYIADNESKVVISEISNDVITYVDPSSAHWSLG